MQFPRSAFFLAVMLGFSACETPLGQTWNNAVSRLSPQPEDDSDARNGLHPGKRQPQSQSIDADTVYLGPKPSRKPAASQPSSTPGTVKLKPFRSSSQVNLAPTPRPSPKPSPKSKPTTSVSTSPTPKPTPKSSPKSSPSPTPKPVVKRQTAPTPNLEKPEPEATPKPTPKAVEATEPPPFASPVMGKKGYVTSPYSPDAGFIDVTGLEPGSMAKDPYSGKVFRVP